MQSSLVYLLAFGIGFVTGLRSMTGPALVCWAAHLALDQPGRFTPGVYGIPACHIRFFRAGAGRTCCRQVALHSQPDFARPSVRSRSPGRAFGSDTVCRDRRFPGLRCDTRRSGRSDRRVCGISGAGPPGKDLTFAGLDHCLVGRSDRGWRWPSPGFAILTVSA